MLDQSKPFRTYRLNVFPYKTHTVAMLTCTDWHGRTENDRRAHTWDLPIPRDDLHGAGPTRALEMVMRELLDRLDPPIGYALAEPPVPPSGGNGGVQETFPELRLLLGGGATL